jgi:hypothetical protein
MRLAWFRTTPPDARDLLDRTAPLIEVLRRTHDITVITAAQAHDFVWRHDRQPYDLCIYEPGPTPAHRFIWPYLLQYPGLVIPAAMMTIEPRAWTRARAVVVGDAAVAESLRDEWHATIKVATPGVRGRRHSTDGVRARHRDLAVGTLDGARADLLQRAIDRARRGGAAVTLDPHGEPEMVLQTADVIVALEWPPAAGPPLAALHGMAAALPVVVLEVEATAGWPALNPQTWQPREFSAATAVAVSIDPRDEEHSLVLTLARLAADAALRTRLGEAGHAWWAAHATLDHAVASWDDILAEAVALYPAAPEPLDDGSARAREILDELGVSVDFLSHS